MRAYTRHSNNLDAAQSFSFTVTAPGYITQKRNISVNAPTLPEQVFDLVPSDPQDTTLSALNITNSAPGTPIIIVPMENFDPDTLSYTMTVGAIPSITIQAPPCRAGATVRIYWHGTAANATNNQIVGVNLATPPATTVSHLRQHADAPTETVIQIIVTVPTGTALPENERTRTYTLTITRTNREYPLQSLVVNPSKSPCKWGIIQLRLSSHRPVAIL